MLDPVPGRGRDAVPLLPREGFVADAALAASFDDVEDAAPRPPLRPGALARPQPLRLTAHGAKRETARARIDVAEHDLPILPRLRGHGQEGGAHRAPRPAHLRIARVLVARGAWHQARRGELILRGVDGRGRR